MYLLKCLRRSQRALEGLTKPRRGSRSLWGRRREDQLFFSPACKMLKLVPKKYKKNHSFCGTMKLRTLLHKLYIHITPLKPILANFGHFCQFFVLQVYEAQRPHHSNQINLCFQHPRGTSPHISYNTFKVSANYEWTKVCRNQFLWQWWWCFFFYPGEIPNSPLHSNNFQTN